MTLDTGAIDRLASERPGVRRLAAMDLSRAIERCDDTARSAIADAFVERLAAEDDERARVVMIRALGSVAHAGARDTLATLRDDARTPVRVFHAALLASDAIELAQRDS